jgi:hypothetical protein
MIGSVPSNAFGFPVEHVPHGTAQPPAEPPAPAPPDATAAGDKVREKAGMTLSQLTWTFPDGSRRHAKLTSSRWALYEALRVSAVPAPATGDYTQALSLAVSQRFITAPILLWLCLHEPEVWEAPRRDDVALVHDWPALLSEVRRWADDAIPPPRLDDAVQLAELLADLTFSALPVRRASEDDPEPDAAQKKTPL